MRKQVEKIAATHFGHRMLGLVMMACILAITWLGSMNLILRMPDLYHFEFNRVQLTDQLDLSMSDDELATMISDLLLPGAALPNPYQSETLDGKLPLHPKEIAALHLFHQKADQSLLILVIAAGSFLQLYLVLFLLKQKNLLRESCSFTVFGMAGVTLILLLFLSMDLLWLQSVVLSYGFGGVLPPEGILAGIYSPSLMKKGLLLLIAFSWVYYFILFQLTNLLTKPYQMFQKNYVQVRLDASGRR